MREETKGGIDNQNNRNGKIISESGFLREK